MTVQSKTIEQLLSSLEDLTGELRRRNAVEDAREIFERTFPPRKKTTWPQPMGKVPIARALPNLKGTIH